MEQIVLNDQQAKMLAETDLPIAVCDSDGNVLGFISPSEYAADRQYVESVNAEAARHPGRVEQLVREGLESGEPIAVTDEWWEEKRSTLSSRIAGKEDV